MPQVVTRKDLETILCNWEQGVLSSRQVYDWANDRFCTSDWETDCDVSNEVLALLDTLNINLVVPADIPILRMALEAATLEDACAVLELRLPDDCALEARLRECAGDPLYPPANE